MRSALIWLGKADPVKSMEMTMGEDPEREELAAMLEAWSDVLGTGSDTRRRLSSPNVRQSRPRTHFFGLRFPRQLSE